MNHPSIFSVLALSGAMLFSVGLPVPAAYAEPSGQIFSCMSIEGNQNKIVLSFEGEKTPDLSRADLSGVKVAPRPDDLAAVGGKGILELQGTFEPDRIYSVSVPKTVKGAGNAELKRDVFLQVRIRRNDPSFRFQTKGTLFPLHAENFVLPYETEGCKEIEVSVWRMFDSVLDQFTSVYPDTVRDFGVPVVKKAVLPVSEGRKIHSNLDLKDLIGRDKPGVYAVKILGIPQDETNSGWWWDRNDSRLLIVSDLAASAATDEEARTAKVFVNYISSGKPVPSGTVRLMTRKYQTAAEGEIRDGLAQLVFAGTYDPAHDSLSHYVIRSGNDATLLPLNWNTELNKNGNEGKTFQSGCDAFVYAERDIVRPGETIHPAAFLRMDRKPLAGAPIRLMLRDPSGHILFSEQKTTSPEGFLSCGFTIPEHAPTGTYMVLCGISPEKIFGSFPLTVAAFHPDRIRVALTPGKPVFSGREDIVFQTSAEYYFGGEVPDARWTFNLTATKPFFPDHWKSWKVGTGFRRGIELEEKSGTGIPGKPVLVRIPENLAQEFSTPLNCLATWSVTEPGSRTVTASSGIRYFGETQYIGIREKSGAVQKTLELAMLPAEADARPEGETVRYSLSEIRWEYNSRRDSSGRIVREWEEISVPVKKFSGELALTGTPSELVLADLPAGQYLLKAESGTKRTEYGFWHSAGESGARLRDPNTLTFQTDKEIHLPGETAKLSLDVPADSVLLVVHGEHSAEQAFRAEVPQGGTATLEIPIRADTETEAWHGTVTVLSGKGKNLNRSFGFFTLKLDQSAHRLIPAVKLPETIRPGEKAEAEITLTDAAGAPRSGLVHIFAVDEGILALTDFRTPDIFHAFYGPLFWNTDSHDIYGQIYPDLKLLPDGSIGGGEGSALAKRLEAVREKKSAVFVLDPVRVPASGKVKAILPFPDHTGAMRVMAVAASEDRTGSSAVSVKLRDKANVLISSPSAADPGDEFDLTLTVHNTEFPADQEIAVSVKLPDFLTSDEPPTRNLRIPLRASETFAVRCKVPEKPGTTGDIAVTLKAEGLDRTVSLPFTVRSGSTFTVKSDFLSLQPGETKTVSASAGDWMKSTRTLTVSSNPAEAAADALDWLNRYPYGCAEQTVSTALPCLGAGNLVKAGLLDPRAAGSVKDRIEAAERNLLSMLNTRGEFSMWPNGSASWDEATVYAALFLFEANAKGLLKTEQTVLRKLRNTLRREKFMNSRIMTAWTLYARAAAGDDAITETVRTFLRENDKDYPALLAALAMIRLGYAEEGAKMLETPMRAGAWRAPETIFSCAPEAGTGMLLALLAENAPRTPELPQIAATLRSSLRGNGSAWGTTQANAWAVLGLAAFAAEYPPAPIEAAIRPDNAPESVVRKETSIVLPNGQSASVTNRSKGILFLRIREEGLPKRSAIRSGGPIRITRVFQDEKGNPVASAKHGDLLKAVVTIQAPCPVDDLVLCDILPAGLEIEDGSLATRKTGPASFSSNLIVKNVEKRSDRFLFFGSSCDAGRCVITYPVRAVTRGTFRLPATTAEAMYQPDLTGISAEPGTFRIE